uniref:Water-specific aquaporin n=1 Tax=Lumbricus rubellus TaxID=35632 RepID=C0MP65_LUMRU|nr:water-specific aquaporin [Lumbricus rubellus]
MSTSSLQDLKTRRFWVALLAEFLGTLLLVLVACGSCAGYTTTYTYRNQTDGSEVVKTKPLPSDFVQISLAFGLSVATIVWSIAHVSGGHINPGVTIGFLVTRKISLVRAILYTAVQSVGAVLGAVILKLVSPPGLNDALGTTSPGNGVSIGQAFTIELFITFVLVYTVFATCDGQRQGFKGSGPLAIGLSISMCHLWAIPYTGSGMNPARAFGSALVAGKLEPGIHWVYWAGPLLGGALAGILYDFLFATNATLDKLKGFFTSDYDDSQYDSRGRRSAADPNESGVRLKETA